MLVKDLCVFGQRAQQSYGLLKLVRSTGVACVCYKPIGHVLDAQGLHGQQLCSGDVLGSVYHPL